MPLAVKPAVRGKPVETLVSAAAKPVVRAEGALAMDENSHLVPNSQLL